MLLQRILRCLHLFFSCGRDGCRLNLSTGSWATCLFRIPYRQLPLLGVIMASKPKASDNLDSSRQMVMDPRDPRSKTSQWPCFGNHSESNFMSNKWGAWKTCRTCGIRVIYVPKQGAPASDTKQVNGPMMLQALEELQNLLPQGMAPDENLVKTMMEKVIAETRMKTLLQEYEKQWSMAQEKIVKAKLAVKPPARGSNSSAAEGYPKMAPMSPSRSTTSWEQIPSPQSEEKSKGVDMWELLTEEERQQIFQRVQSRLPPAPQSDVELEPDYAAQ